MVCRFLPPKDDAAEGTEADRFELAAPEASKVTQYGLQHLRAAPSAQPAEAPQSADADWMAARRGMTRQDDAEKVVLSSFPQPTCMTQLHLPCFCLAGCSKVFRWSNKAPLACAAWCGTPCSPSPQLHTSNQAHPRVLLVSLAALATSQPAQQTGRSFTTSDTRVGGTIEQLTFGQL